MSYVPPPLHPVADAIAEIDKLERKLKRRDRILLALSPLVWLAFGYWILLADISSFWRGVLYGAVIGNALMFGRMVESAKWRREQHEHLHATFDAAVGGARHIVVRRSDA